VRPLLKLLVHQCAERNLTEIIFLFKTEHDRVDRYRTDPITNPNAPGDTQGCDVARVILLSLAARLCISTLIYLQLLRPSIMTSEMQGSDFVITSLRFHGNAQSSHLQQQQQYQEWRLLWITINYTGPN